MRREKRPHIENTRFWNLPVFALQYILKDASEAARAMRDHNPKAECKYLDQYNDACTVLDYRRRNR